MKGSTNLAALVRARLFELVDEAGRIAARLGRDPLFPFRRKLALFGRDSPDPAVGGTAQTGDPFLTWQNDDLSFPKVGVPAISFFQLVVGPRTSPQGTMDTTAGVTGQHSLTAADAGTSAARIIDAPAQGPGTAYVEAGSRWTGGVIRERSVKWDDDCAPVGLQGYGRLSGMGRGLAAYGNGVGVVDIAPGASLRVFTTGGHNGGYGAGIGTPVRFRADRQYRWTMQIRAVEGITLSTSQAPIALDPLINLGAIGGVSSVYKIVQTAQWDTVQAQWFFPGNLSGDYFCSVLVTNRSAGETLRFYLDDLSTCFLLVEDVGANRWVELSGQPGGPAPYPADVVQSIEGPWTDL